MVSIDWDKLNKKAENAGDKVGKVMYKANKVGSGTLGFLRTANAALEQIPIAILSYFEALKSMGENVSQAFVDAACRYAAWMVNISIERIRQKVLKSVYEHNIMVRIVVDVIEIGKKVITNPLGAICTFFERLTAPFKVAKEIITDIIKEIARLAANLSKIMEMLPPEPPRPDINFDEFQIKINAIGLSALAPADSFPAPEVIFPKPSFPFGKETFKNAFEEGKKSFTENEGVQQTNKSIKKVLYRPKKKAAMEGEIA